MIPKIWTAKPEVESPKRVILRLDPGGALRAVNRDGENVAVLITFLGDRAHACTNARGKLAGNDYDTTWCKWDENGAMVLSND